MATPTPELCWNKRYDSEEYTYGTQPNAFLVSVAKNFKQNSRILVPGDGEGRNGVWLVGQGHDVTSLDLSTVALAKAERLAQMRGVQLHTEAVDLIEYPLSENTFDAVVLIYLHLPPSVRSNVHRKLARSLKPEGWLVLEAFHPNQRLQNYESGGPGNVALLYDVPALRTDWQGLLKEHFAWTGEITLNEGEGHSGAGYVVRYLGQKNA